MLEDLLILTRGGLILWAFGELVNEGSVIRTLVSSGLLEDGSCIYDPPGESYSIRWTFHKKLGLVFVAVYDRVLNLLSVDDFLGRVKREFAAVYDPAKMNYTAFDDVYRKLTLQAEDIKDLGGKQLQKTNKNSGHGGGVGELKWNGDAHRDSRKRRKTYYNGYFTYVERQEDWTILSILFDPSKLLILLLQGYQLKDSKVALKKKKPDAEVKVAKDGVDDHVMDVSPNEGESYDHADGCLVSISSNPRYPPIRGSRLRIPVKHHLGRADLELPLEAFKDMLMTKNVAEGIAEKLCESAATSLEGKRCTVIRDADIYPIVQAAIEDSLVSILTPKYSIDLLRDVHAAKEQGKPYVVVFVGANEVGKSTSLAKVAYWLLQQNVSVMMAACDTVHPGAVEQLRTHARRLHIPIFENGDEKDPAVVAKEAIQEASCNGSDVVLVDTAGWIQDNEPLMCSLSKLIYLNSPDLLLFVGEAFGNEAMDQLSKLNQKLADLSTSPNPRLINGILLTKFDLAEDKVGASVSMVYNLGSPVMFIGHGESYTDLKKLCVKSIVKKLLKQSPQYALSFRSTIKAISQVSLTWLAAVALFRVIG